MLCEDDIMFFFAKILICLIKLFSYKCVGDACTICIPHAYVDMDDGEPWRPWIILVICRRVENFQEKCCQNFEWSMDGYRVYFRLDVSMVGGCILNLRLLQLVFPFLPAPIGPPLPSINKVYMHKWMVINNNTYSRLAYINETISLPKISNIP